ncbi:putative Mitochondrial small ribosomal subunit Rsm22-domain-containing protein [Seiridium cardinale]|uniref:Mitochondrial small ribosomal subunit Rsm22-domain-containing protein n=1 Tax=Seiridium cardinale TaxID=138064 RepID=A0ABR2XAX5_9PEZI
MLSARKVQKACPSCRAQLLSLFENGFASVTTRPQRPAPNSFHNRRSPLSAGSRPFSSTRRKLQDGQPETASAVPSVPQTPEELEMIVRQAKHQFGNTLPKGYLNEEELKLYTRYYGAPLRETRPEDVGMPIDQALLAETHKYVLVKNKNMLLKENEDGELQEVDYHVPQLPEASDGAPEGQDELVELAEDEDLPSDAGIDYIKVVAKNHREFDALLKLQRDFEKASLRPADREAIEEDEEGIEEEQEEIEEEEEDDGEVDAEFALEEIPDRERVHQLSELGQWRTNPTTLHLPKTEFVAPIHTLLGRTDIKHVREAAEKAFGGIGLPHSVATPHSGKNSGQLAIPMEAGHSKMSEIEADAYIATNLPGMYASTMAVLVEIRKRMGPHWLQGLLSRGNGEGPRVLDVGTGGGALAAWERVLQTEWDLLHGSSTGKGMMGPPGKKTVVVGSDRLRHRVSRFLNNTQFLPRLPDYLHSGAHVEKMDDSELPAPRKVFDVIIASHQLMPFKEEHKRKAFIDNLWEMLSPEGGILIVLEKGHPRGFEAVAHARQRLLDEFIECPTSDPQPETLDPETRRIREPGMIVAPCTNHKKCPMYLTPGMAHGRKDFCHFSQRFIRPPFLQRVLDAAHRNHQDIDFSFVAVQRGVTASSPTPLPTKQGKDASDAAFEGYEHATEAPNPLSLPRTVMPPLKRTGHVTLDMCTPAGTIERWTVPKSFSRQAYRDARKAQWGDLWALGAKTRVVRAVRLGKGGIAPNDGGIRARRAAEAVKAKIKVVNLDAGSSGIFKANEKGGASGGNLLGGRGRVPTERRTKGGKKVRQRRVRDILGEED